MQNLLYKISRIISNLSVLPGVVFGLLKKNKNVASDYMIPLCEAMETKTDYFVTTNFSPKYVSDCGYLFGNCLGLDFKNCAIVLQGPIKYENDFTLETIRFYQNLYPKVKVILSTWKSENEEYIKQIENETCCFIVQSEQPEFLDVMNMNRQTVSTFSGLNKAKELGVEYVLKSRTDFRFLREDFLHCLLDRIESFPVNDTYSINQNKRIIVFKTGLFQPLYMPEFFNFGNIDDMINFWNHPIRRKNFISGSIRTKGNSYKSTFESRGVTEIEYGYSYFERQSVIPSCDLDWWWNVLKDYFICMSASEANYFWYKYHITRDSTYQNDLFYRDLNARKMLHKATVSFEIWKAIYENRFCRNPIEDNAFLECEF